MKLDARTIMLIRSAAAALSAHRFELLAAVPNFVAAWALIMLTGYLGAAQLFVYGSTAFTDDPYYKASAADVLLFVGREISYFIIAAFLVVCSVCPTLFSRVLPRQLQGLRWYCNYLVYLTAVVYVVFSDETGTWWLEDTLKRLHQS